MRADRYLSEKLGVSRRYAQELIRRGNARLNGKPLRKSDRLDPERLEPGALEIEHPRPGETSLEPENIPLEIIYRDQSVAVINKPAGITTHPFGRVVSGTLVNALLYHLERLPASGGPMRPGIVHRLDRETSGVMVVALTDRAYRFLAGEFQQRTVRKTYRCFVKGVVPWESREVSLPLKHSPGDWRRMSVGFIGGRESRTLARVARRFPAATELVVFPRTGRTHQIRVVLDFLGFPLIGDKRYGQPSGLDSLIGRHALHASELDFRHPDTGSYLGFSAELPGDMRTLSEHLTEE